MSCFVVGARLGAHTVFGKHSNGIFKIQNWSMVIVYGRFANKSTKVGSLETFSLVPMLKCCWALGPLWPSSQGLGGDRELFVWTLNLLACCWSLSSGFGCHEVFVWLFVLLCLGLKVTFNCGFDTKIFCCSGFVLF